MSEDHVRPGVCIPYGNDSQSGNHGEGEMTEREVNGGPRASELQLDSPWESQREDRGGK